MQCNHRSQRWQAGESQPGDTLLLKHSAVKVIEDRKLVGRFCALLTLKVEGRDTW